MVKTRQKPADADCVMIGLETDEGQSGGADEWVSWFAFESGEGTIGGLKYVAEYIDSVDNNDKEISFPEGYFSQSPQFFASLASHRSDKACELRTVGPISAQKATIKLEADGDSHQGEKIGYVAFNGQSHQAAAFEGIRKTFVTYQWTETEWSECSHTCGKGKRTRDVACKKVPMET